MKPEEIAALVRFGQIGLRTLSQRVLTVIGMIACIALFGYALWLPTWERAVIASLFAVLVYWPLVRIELRKPVQTEVPNE